MLATLFIMAALTAAGTPAMASSHPVTGPEIASGAVYGKPATAGNPVIALTWLGLVNTHGSFSPHGPAPKKGQRQTFATSAGKLTVSITAAPVNIQNVDIKACHFSFTTDVAFAVVAAKSTGRFAQASGPGAIQVYFAGYGPRYASGPKQGQCNTSPSAPELAKGAVASFVLSAMLKA